MKKYDLIIIGAGPAGINAAVYATRYKLKTLVFGQIPGGAAAEANEIENLFGYSKIKGVDLMQSMAEQIKNLEIQMISEIVIDIKKEDKVFIVKTVNNQYSAKNIILATGTNRRKLGLSTEGKYLGKGFHYCATCDAALYKDKIVAVIGGGNSALTAALLVAEFGQKVYLIHRGSDFAKSEPVWVDKVNQNEKIEKVFNANVVELIGEGKIESIKLDTGQDLKVDGVFVEIGSEPNVELAKKLDVKLTEDGHIETDRFQKTSVSGIYAAGDSTDYPLKQIITAAAQGAVAANSIYQEIQKRD